MEYVRNKVVSGESASSGRLAGTIAKYTETMSAVERLCLQSGKTLVALGRADNKGFYSFVRKMMVWTDINAHPTTSAQCISAIQDLLRALNGINLTQPEPANLPFQPLVKGKVDKESLKKFREDLDTTLKEQMAFLANTQLAKSSAEGTDPDWFGELNPFTCAQTFRALAPSEHLISDGCWTTLFGILWALERTYPNYEGASGVAMPHSLPTAFVTSHCIDAIESLVQALGRREERFKGLIKLIKQLEKIESAKLEKQYAEISFVHQTKILREKIVTSLREIAQDAALKELFDLLLTKIYSLDFSADQLRAQFIDAFTDSKDKITERLNKIEKTHTSLNDEVVLPIGKIASWFANGSSTDPPCTNGLPNGLIEDRYLKATDNYYIEHVSGGLPSAWMKQQKRQLKIYWKDQNKAVQNAIDTCKDLQNFLHGVFTCYGNVTSAVPLSDQLILATRELPEKRKNLQALLKGAISWSEGVMNHQLALFHSAKMGAFDAAELAHAARTLSRTGATKHAVGVLDSIDAICTAQNPDGNWPCSKPFFWTHGGIAALPHSAEVAWALVSIMRTVVNSPETFGMGQSEALAHLDNGNQTLRKYLGWLSATAHTYPLPALLEDKLVRARGESLYSQVFGWGSDRTPEPDLVHTWATANVVEFLIEFRDLLQDQINTALRVEFLSYHPSDLPQLEDFLTPDLSKDYEERIGRWLRCELQGHTERAKRETHWIPGAKYDNKDLKLFSAILAGPPGSAKSYLAQCIAGELGWPLLAFSPSDFLSAGEANVEARAREIFDSLKSGSRLVYFFDEIDELIVDRSYTQREQGRSVFSFLTPSFLTKIQDLRDAAACKQFLFLIGTNYLDRIDPAAKRTGRIDETKLILYPDSESRKSQIFKELREKFNSSKIDPKAESSEFNEFLTELKLYSSLDSIVNATALLSIPALNRVCTMIFSAHSTDSVKFWKEFDIHIKNLQTHKSPWVKWDVDLDVYWGRPGAVDEWCEMMDLVSKDDKWFENQLYGYLRSLTQRWNLHGKRVKEQICNHEAKWLTPLKLGLRSWSPTGIEKSK